MYSLLDTAFAVSHALLILFVVLGWASERTRRLHILVLTLTFASWLGLGLFFGIGYCPCTDWHWQIKRALGETDLPRSYVKYYLDRMTGGNWSPQVVDAAVVLTALGALTLSLRSYLRDRSAEGPVPRS